MPFAAIWMHFRRKGMPVAVCAGLLFAAVEAKASDRQLQLGWSELAGQVVGRKISMTLTDGVTLEGKGVSVKAASLVMDVNKTSAPARFSGTADVPRELVSTVRVSRPGWKWRVIGPLVGFVGLSIVGGAIGNRINPDGFIISDGAAQGVTVGAIAGVGLGYLVGHFADRHHTTIQVLP
ncbi:MAG: hypothetical protein ABI824_03145 [Acidobacteriota bacterium]